MAFMKKSPTSASTAQPRRGWFVASRATFWIFWLLSTVSGPPEHMRECGCLNVDACFLLLLCSLSCSSLQHSTVVTTCVAFEARRVRDFCLVQRISMAYCNIWLCVQLASTGFAVLALLSFVQMHRVHNTPNFTGGRQIRGPMAGTCVLAVAISHFPYAVPLIFDCQLTLSCVAAAEFFGAVAVVFTNAVAFITLLWKTARRNGTGFGYVCMNCNTSF